MSRFDKLYRRFIITKQFTKGWGNPDHLSRLFDFRKIISKRESCQKLVDANYEIHIDKETDGDDHRVLDGHFTSPFVHHLPGIMPPEVEKARFQVILPKTWKGPHKPMCLQLAGTGDHKFGRRKKLMGLPLLKEYGIASILLENPYYGYRKPKSQLRSSLHYVSDLFVMGGALVLESMALLHWCERQGFGPLGMTGISMGGHMASLAVTNWHKPINLVPCLSWSTAGGVFTEGVISSSIPWDLMKKQYNADRVFQDVLANQIVSPEDCRQEILSNRLHHSLAHTNDVPKENQKSNHIMSDSLHVPPSSTQAQQGAQYHTSSHHSSNANQSHFMDMHDNRTRLKGKLKGFVTKESNKYSGIIDYMRRMMDECTHLGNFDIPVDPELIVIVLAKHDSYVPIDTVMGLDELWPGSEVRYIDRGHITSFLFHQRLFRLAIKDAFDKQIEKYF